MTLKAKLATVRTAEDDCAVRRAGIAAAWNGFKRESELAATPGRVIGAGLVAGFVTGLRGSGGAVAGSGIGGKLLGMLLENVFASVSAGLAAGAAAADVEQGADAEASRQSANRG